MADSLWLVADGKLQVIDGDLDDYQQWLRSRAKAAPPAASKRASKAAPKSAARDAARARGGVSKLRRESAEIEKRIAAITDRRTLVEEELCRQPLNQALQSEYAELTADAASMETRWMEVGTALEAAEAESGEAG